MKKSNILSLTLACVVLLSGCSAVNSVSSDTETESLTTPTSDTSEKYETVEVQTSDSDMFTDRDYEIGYDENDSVSIKLNGNSAECESDSVDISGSTVTVKSEGTYIISGTLYNGMIIVDTPDTEKVQLVLDGVTINSKTSAAIYVLESDKVFITLVPNSENTLSTGGEFTAIDDNNIDSVIFSKVDLTLNGNGTLTINSPAGHGIVSKDDLVITGGRYIIDASSHGITGKDSVRISDGTFTVTSGKDGIHAENSDDASLGFMYIYSGTYKITSDGDGLSAESYLQIDGGDFAIVTDGGSGNASVSQSNAFGPGSYYYGSSASTADTASAKGLKSAGKLILGGGSFNIDSSDDAIHSNGDLFVNGGSYQISTGDDGLHSDTTLTISAGSINIEKSYEGIEGMNIIINGGDISLTSSDDGLNAAGGNDQSGFAGRGQDAFAADSGSSITISGGKLYINASGDGVDSNGSLTVSGGETYVSGPTNNNNGALDYNSDATITGGIFVAAGASGMAQGFGTSSTQGAILTTVSSQSSGSTISLTSSDGNEIISWTPDNAYNSVVISAPEITEGSTYTLRTGSTETSITMSSLVYGSSSGMGGMGGMGMPSGGMGGMGGGMR